MWIRDSKSPSGGCVSVFLFFWVLATWWICQEFVLPYTETGFSLTEDPSASDRQGTEDTFKEFVVLTKQKTLQPTELKTTNRTKITFLWYMHNIPLWYIYVLRQKRGENTQDSSLVTPSRRISTLESAAAYSPDKMGISQNGSCLNPFICVSWRL